MALWLWTLFLVALQGVFIGAEGGRVPVEVVHEGGSLDMTGLPRFRGLMVAAGHALWRVASPGPVHLVVSFWKLHPGS